jgi:hypothetical protein
VSAKGFMLLALNPASASYVARLSGSISVCTESISSRAGITCVHNPGSSARVLADFGENELVGVHAGMLS